MLGKSAYPKEVKKIFEKLKIDRLSGIMKTKKKKIILKGLGRGLPSIILVRYSSVVSDLAITTPRVHVYLFHYYGMLLDYKLRLDIRVG